MTAADDSLEYCSLFSEKIRLDIRVNPLLGSYFLRKLKVSSASISLGSLRGKMSLKWEKLPSAYSLRYVFTCFLSFHECNEITHS